MSENVTEQQLQDYLRVFRDTYVETATKLLPPAVLPYLLRMPVIQSDTVGYVSTNFGMGFEYLATGHGEIHTVRSSSRIEDLFFGPPREIRDNAPMFAVMGRDIALLGLTFDCNHRAYPVRMVFADSQVRFVDLLFYSGEWRREVVFAELDSRRQATEWTTDKAVGRAKDEVRLRQRVHVR